MNDDTQISWWEASAGMKRVALATTGFAVWHSLLCSRGAKQCAKRVLGEKRGGAVYRVFFIGQSVITAGALVLFVLRQPHRTLHQQHGWKRVACWIGQGVCLLIGARALRDIGPRHFSGVESLQDWRDDKHSIREPEAQSPSLDGNNANVTGVFRWSRHPLEWAPVALLWFTPHFKTNWLAFNALAALYSLLGAMHEEKRLMENSPEEFARYQKEVSFFIGRSRDT